MIIATNYLIGYYRHCVMALYTLSYFILLTPQKGGTMILSSPFLLKEIWLVPANPGII